MGSYCLKARFSGGILVGVALSLLRAQEVGDLIVVSETGELFRFYLNGEWILSQPGTRAEVHDLHAGFHKGTIYLYPSEGRVIQLKRTFLVEGGHVEYYAIQKNRKGQYEVKVYNRAVREPSGPPAVGDGPPSAQPPQPAPTGSSPAPSPGSGGVQVQTGTQNQTIIFNPTIQIQTGGGGTQVSGQGGSGASAAPQPPVHTGSTYTGPCNCQQPMSREAFQRALSTVQEQTFDNTRMDIAKAIARSNCLLASDVKALAAAFQFENFRLEFAKFAYDYTLDLGNYFEVEQAFDYEATRTELMKYAQRRTARYFCQGVAVGPAPVPGDGQSRPSSGGGNPATFSSDGSAGVCQPCMSATDFTNALRTIQNTAGDMTRLEVARSLLASSCLSAQQVRDMCGAFASEAYRLEFAKAAYRRCCDPGNYLVVNDAFISSYSREELARFIQAVGR